MGKPTGGAGKAGFLTLVAASAIAIADRYFDHLNHKTETEHAPTTTKVEVKGGGMEGKYETNKPPSQVKDQAAADKVNVENDHKARKYRLDEENYKNKIDADAAVMKAGADKQVQTIHEQSELQKIDFETKKEDKKHHLDLTILKHEKEVQNERYKLEEEKLNKEAHLKHLRDSINTNKLIDDNSSNSDLTSIRNYLENKDSFIFFQDQDYIMEKTLQGAFDYPIEVKKGFINNNNLSDYRDLQDNSLLSSPGSIDEQKDSFTLSDNVEESENSSTLPLFENVDGQENSTTDFSSSPDYTDTSLVEMFIEIISNLNSTPISEMSTTLTILALLLIGLITISALISIWMIIIYDQIKNPLRKYKKENPEFLNFRHSVVINKFIIA